MKRLFCILFSIICCSVFAQTRSYETPRVDQSYRSTTSDMRVLGVVCDEESTVVLIEDITRPHTSDLWISLGSNTALMVKGSSRRYRIQEWGLIDNEDATSLKLDKQYSQTADRRYVLYLMFEAIPTTARVLDIIEPNGFFWKGIHLESSASSPDRQHQGGTQNGGLLKSEREASGRGQNAGGSSARRSGRPFEATASGTCFAISSNGYLATAYHVVEGASRIRIKGVNGNFDKNYPAKVVASDRENDVAILRISDPSFSSLGRIPYEINFGVANVGEEVFVLGFPLRALMGDDIKLTTGVVSSRSGFQGDNTCYQISATVQSGNSGGPLFNSNGEVIGVISSRLMVESAAYAVKTSYLQRLIGKVSGTVTLPKGNTVRGKKLSEQVSEIQKFVYLIEVEQ
ncbi:MAG: serine protease [Bacteroidales bacterium]|nr:serine protease [Bacteroidales bacterium]